MRVRCAVRIMNTLDLVDTGQTCSLVSRLIRTDKDIDELIAGTFTSVIKLVRTPDLTASDLVVSMSVLCAIGEELLVRRALVNAVAAKACA